MVRFLSLSCSLGKTAGSTGAHAVGLRCVRCLRRSGWQVEFRPDGLAGHRSELDAPAVGEGLDEEEAPSRLGVGCGGAAAREVVTASVRDLDAEGRAAGQEYEAEVASGEPAVGGGIGGEFGDEVFGGLGDAVRQIPGAHPVRGEEPGEAGTAWRGGQQDAEVVAGCEKLGGLFLVHITERGGACLP